MFKILPVKPARATQHTLINKGMMSPRSASTLLAAALSGALLISGCQQQSAEEPTTNASPPKEKTTAEDNQPMRKSDSAAARIEQFQPLYVAQAQGLQQRLQAEYESLQAADASDSGNDLLLNEATETSEPKTNDQATNNPKTAAPISARNDESPKISNDSDVDIVPDDAINISTEVGERDLTVLKRISLEPRKPIMLTDEQLINSYQQAMEALYQPVTSPLSAEDIDTLINIATLVPQLFEDAEIAGRLSAKSPALARLIIQHQVWEQIEAQQVLDMQQMKVEQQQEFEALMTKFNETIKGYDEQIAKYEQTLKEFQ